MELTQIVELAVDSDEPGQRRGPSTSVTTSSSTWRISSPRSGGHPRVGLSNLEDKLAADVAALADLVGLGRIGQREHLPDLDADRSGFDLR